MKSIKEQIKELPESPGVYYFIGPKGKILYVGKATSLRDRVRSYFSQDLLLTRGPLIEKMIGEAESVKHRVTDSVLEALILEANEIKKYLPYYNTKEKDDKSYNYVIITKEDFPRVLVMRGRELQKSENQNLKIAKQFGPFPHGAELREAMRIVRKIFPFRDKCIPKGELKNPDKAKPCFNAQLGLCPGPCAGWVSKKDYAKHVRHITLFFEGRKEKLIESLEKDMKALAKEKRFEDAEKVKKQIFALDHIQDIALLKKDMEKDISEETFRIEAYDVAHLSGRDVVGVMTVIEDGELSKSQYRKFKIKADKNDDVANLKEIVSRRLGHPEWLLPNLIVVDGGTAQMNAVKLILREEGLNIGVVSVVKDASHKAREIMGSKLHVQNHARAILLANAEAHRFAIGYHRRLRGKGFRI